jgi:hypothetical protein
MPVPGFGRCPFHWQVNKTCCCAVRPNPSLEPIRYGKHCKAGLRYSVHCLSPALQCLPPLSSQLER